uniref:Ultraviolet sensitive opsin n=1 Tax=Stylops melittae TaxID=50597 RepID=A0A1P8SFJ1_9NEOP|nr:ultraviolet sensitive opsin [Stylops melittae]
MHFNWTIIDVVSPLARTSESEHKLIGWNLSPEELEHIPEHWLSFPEPEASIHYLLGLIYIGFFLAAIFGNGLVLWIFSTSKSLQTPSNIFVVNLAFCDFMMMLKTPIFIYNSFYRGYALGFTGCQVFSIMGALSGIGAGTTNACIAYDRYMTIARPFDGKVSKGKALFMVLCIWMYVIPWTLMPYFEVWGRFVPEAYLTSCTFDYMSEDFDNHLFVASIFSCSYVFPLFFMIIYYSRIVSHVVAHENALKEQAKKMNVESLRSNQSGANTSVEIRIAKSAITMCALFVASWTPYGTIAMIGAFGDKSVLTPGVTMIPALTCKFVACIDPYIFAISHPRYRAELEKRVSWLGIKETLPDDKKSTASETVTVQATSE